MYPIIITVALTWSLTFGLIFFLKKKMENRDQGIRIVPPPPPWHQKWQEVLIAYPVGRHFNYLGVIMVTINISNDGGPPFFMPCMTAEYADRNGVIRQAFFKADMFPVLLPSSKTECPQ